jgi:hypothetical protein
MVNCRCVLQPDRAAAKQHDEISLGNILKMAKATVGL